MMEKTVKNRKGFFFSLITILLIIPLIMFIMACMNMPDTRINDALGRTRCEKLYFFTEDVKEDINRAMEISGRRAAISAQDYVIETGDPLENYTFNCSENCAFNCSRFNYYRRGSDAAIVELMLCGTLFGENNSNIENHTFTEWVRRIKNVSEEMNYNIEFGIFEMEVGMADAWTIYSRPRMTIKVSDAQGLCYYEGIPEDVEANTSIIGLQDPLFPLNTRGMVMKFIEKCPIDVDTRKIAGCSGSNMSNGSVTGYVIFKDDIGNKCDIRDYCENTPPEELAKQILVIPNGVGFGTCVCGTDDFSWCFKASNESHFGGVIDYGPNNPTSMIYKCNVTIPWIINTGDIDDDPPENPPRETGCGANESLNITNNSCVYIYTNEDCNMHLVGVGMDSSEIKTGCYNVSNINETTNQLCPVGYSNGPSFLDRLDGRPYLSNKYADQSESEFNTREIGIETLIDPYRIFSYTFLEVRGDATWIDYLYWQNISGSPAIGDCGEGDFIFRMDCPHAFKYSIDTEDISATGCCGDGNCMPWRGEDCGNCPADCTCPEGCPAHAGITDCKTCGGPSDCNVTYVVTVQNSTGYMNLSINPTIHITTNETDTDSHVMDKIISQTGIYVYTAGVLDKNDDINATAHITEAGCPEITNSTNNVKVSTLPDCP